MGRHDLPDGTGPCNLIVDGDDRVRYAGGQRRTSAGSIRHRAAASALLAVAAELLLAGAAGEDHVVEVRLVRDGMERAGFVLSARWAEGERAGRQAGGAPAALRRQRR